MTVHLGQLAAESKLVGKATRAEGRYAGISFPDGFQPSILCANKRLAPRIIFDVCICTLTCALFLPIKLRFNPAFQVDLGFALTSLMRSLLIAGSSWSRTARTEATARKQKTASSTALIFFVVAVKKNKYGCFLCWILFGSSSSWQSVSLRGNTWRRSHVWGVNYTFHQQANTCAGSTMIKKARRPIIW